MSDLIDIFVSRLNKKLDISVTKYDNVTTRIEFENFYITIVYHFDHYHVHFRTINNDYISNTHLKTFDEVKKHVMEIINNILYVYTSPEHEDNCNFLKILKMFGTMCLYILEIANSCCQII
jgi:hypothetical protein